MKNFVQAGSNLTLIAPAAVASGSIVKVGSIIGVACGSAANGADVDVATYGVFDLPKVGTDDIAQGDLVYHRASDGLVTKTASGNTKLGVAVSPAGNPSGSVKVRLSGAF
jgi:predicted RecA/RadA family phage recombinase